MRMGRRRRREVEDVSINLHVNIYEYNLVKLKYV